MVFNWLVSLNDFLSTLVISKYTIFLVSNEEVKTTSNAPSMDEDSLTTLISVANNIVDMQSEMENTTGISSLVTVGEDLVDDSRKNYNRLDYGKNDTHGYIDMLTTPEYTTEHKTNTMGPEENEYDSMKVTATLIPSKTNAVQVDSEAEKQGKFSCKNKITKIYTT